MFKIEGYECECLHGASYSCKAWNLYGYATEKQLKSAIKRASKKWQEKHFEQTQQAH